MPRIKKFNRRGLMGDKDKKKDQAEGGKNIKENKTVSTLNDTLEKVFR